MNVTIINKSDTTGGAAVVSRRLMEALRAEGVNARMIVAEKLSDSPYVALAASPLRMKGAFLTERLGIFLRNGLDRSTLFKIDTADCGIDLSCHPWVRDADVICLNWVNQGLLSLRDIRKIGRLGKPIVWTMHDMWNMTGICHHAGECGRWKEACGRCPILGKHGGPKDMSALTWKRKRRLYSDVPIHFVAVSNWLAGKARESSLMKELPLSVIPNAFPIKDFKGASDSPRWGEGSDTLKIIMGAARLDDPIKGLPVLRALCEELRRNYPALADKCRLVTFGALKDPGTLDNLAIPHTHLGPMPGKEVERVCASGDVILSTSLYETLPGTLVEGMAGGCVPVALDRGGQSDIFTHLSTGYLADGNLKNADRALAAGISWAAETLVSDPSVRTLMRESVIERFSARSVANAYIRLFYCLGVRP